MKKKVNIYPTVPIYLIPPITGVSYNVDMNEGDIQVCILRRARVEEILSDGTILPLNLSNYNTINEKLESVKEVKEEIKIVETIKEIPVVEEHTTIEDEIEEVISDDSIVEEPKEEQRQPQNQKKYVEKGKNKR